MQNHIAERKLLLEVIETGERRSLTVRIGMPYQKSDNDFRCPTEYAGLYNKVADVSGVDAIQALALACNVDLMLKDQKKYRFYWPGGEDYFDETESPGDVAFKTAAYLMERFSKGCTEERLTLIDELLEEAALQDGGAKKFKEDDWGILRNRMLKLGQKSSD